MINCSFGGTFQSGKLIRSLPPLNCNTGGGISFVSRGEGLKKQLFRYLGLRRVDHTHAPFVRSRPRALRRQVHHIQNQALVQPSWPYACFVGWAMQPPQRR